uniref:Rab-GAP TBC domain-containing protein n=1 Tax=Syphacia muris TaxID=451379 RepID=A0A0N5A8Z6_9BILA
MHGVQRNRSFSDVAQEALAQISKHCSQLNQQKWRSTIVQRYNEVQLIIDNDLFLITPDRRSTRLNSVQQLSLIQMLCTYFNEKEVEPHSFQYANFETIFCGREGETLLHEIRISILQKLCSLALQYPCYSLFILVATWLHKIGNSRPYAQEFIGYLVNHFVCGPSNLNLHLYLMPLGEKAEEFAAYFVTYAVTLTTIKSVLMSVLEYWLCENESSRILAVIREKPIIAKFFADNTFGALIVYDCLVGESSRTALHGIISEVFVNWPDNPPLQLFPSIKESAAKQMELNGDVLRYHVHLALKRGYMTKKDISDFLESPDMRLRFNCLLEFCDETI